MDDRQLPVDPDEERAAYVRASLDRSRGYGDHRTFISGINDTFGKYARTRRRVLGLSQARVAVEMSLMYGVKWHQTVVAKIESGERLVRLDEAYGLAHLYDIALEDFVRGRDLDRVVTSRVEVKDDGKRMTVFSDARKREGDTDDGVDS